MKYIASLSFFYQNISLSELLTNSTMGISLYTSPLQNKYTFTNNTRSFYLLHVSMTLLQMVILQTTSVSQSILTVVILHNFMVFNQLISPSVIHQRHLSQSFWLYAKDSQILLDQHHPVRVFFFILLMIPPFKKLFAVKMFAYINPEKGDICYICVMSKYSYYIASAQ